MLCSSYKIDNLYYFGERNIIKYRSSFSPEIKKCIKQHVSEINDEMKQYAASYKYRLGLIFSAISDLLFDIFYKNANYIIISYDIFYTFLEPDGILTVPEYTSEQRNLSSIQLVGKLVGNIPIYVNNRWINECKILAGYSDVKNFDLIDTKYQHYCLGIKLFEINDIL